MMISKNPMTIEMYLRQAGLKADLPVRSSAFNPLREGSDTRFNEVLKSATASRQPVNGRADQGTTLAEYRRRRIPNAVAALFSRSTLHSSRLDGLVAQPSGSAPIAPRRTDKNTGLPVAKPHEPPPSARPKTDACDRSVIENTIGDAARKYKIPRQLIRSVIRAESNFRADAVSPAGAQGLMQLMPATARELGVTDPFDVKQNIDGGAKYLRQMLDRFDGDLQRALAAYNAGPGTVARYDGDVPYRETRDYVRRVLAGMDAAAQSSA